MQHAGFDIDFFSSAFLQGMTVFYFLSSAVQSPPGEPSALSAWFSTPPPPDTCNKSLYREKKKSSAFFF